MRAHHFSFEFFPPKTADGFAKLHQVHSELAALKPEFFSVTFGAGGSTRTGTIQAIADIQAAGSVAAPHLACIAASTAEVDKLLQEYIDMGIDRLVALRGDMPSGVYNAGDFHFARDLVEHVRQTSGAHFHIEVAAYPESHPQARYADLDFDHFIDKVKAGANSAITQYFYNTDAYFRFVDKVQARGVDIPIIPGVMPITNYMRLARFSDACGAEIPRWIRKQLESYGDDSQSICQFGHEVVVQMCHKLLEGGAQGLHFYTMNQSEPVKNIWQALNL